MSQCVCEMDWTPIPPQTQCYWDRLQTTAQTFFWLNEIKEFPFSIVSDRCVNSGSYQRISRVSLKMLVLIQNNMK